MTDYLYTSLAQNGEVIHRITNSAPYACIVCRKQKRKCTKELPTCRLCSRLGKPCHYSDPNPASVVSDEVSVLKGRIDELQAKVDAASSGHEAESILAPVQALVATVKSDIRLSRETRQPSLMETFFLDSFAFEAGLLSVPKTDVHPSKEMVDLLGDHADMKRVVALYFDTVHVWLPFISRKRLEVVLEGCSDQPTAEVALLLLAMKALTEVPQETIQGQPDFYRSAKCYFSALQNEGELSAYMLQAAVLLTVYEISHGLSPAAYLSAGMCIRIGQALGIDNKRRAPQMFGKKFQSWIHAEEEKRTWWAIMLIDRFVSLGLPGHIVATDDPVSNDVLPAQCAAWDAGDMVTSEPVYVASPTNVQAGPFARTCQATNLLGRCIRHHNDHSAHRRADSSQSTESLLEEAVLLHTTLQAFTTLLSSDTEAAISNPAHLFTAMALTLSMLLHHYDPYACEETATGSRTPAQQAFHETAISGAKTTVARVLSFSRLIRATASSAVFSQSSRPSPASLATISPFVIECIYQAAWAYAWFVHETRSTECLDAYKELREVLGLLRQRWRVAGKYLAILDQNREVFFDGNPMLIVS